MPRGTGIGKIVNILYNRFGHKPATLEFPRQPSRGNSRQFEDLAVALAPTFHCTGWTAIGQIYQGINSLWLVQMTQPDFVDSQVYFDALVLKYLS